MCNSAYHRRALPAGLACLWLLSLSSCTAPGPPAVSPAGAAFAYFERPPPGDAWSFKIARWQASQVSLAGGLAERTEPESRSLGRRYLQVRARLRRELARELAHWMQEEARSIYVEDEGVDHWPTLEEVLASDGDDCDGLELLVFSLLRDLGLPAHEVYRAIVQRPADGQHHMVTLWFEDPEDPWVLDPTGAMTLGMPRLSQVPGWVPLKLFSPTEEFSVQRLPHR